MKTGSHFPCFSVSHLCLLQRRSCPGQNFNLAQMKNRRGSVRVCVCVSALYLIFLRGSGQFYLSQHSPQPHEILSCFLVSGFDGSQEVEPEINGLQTYAK